MNKGNHIWSFSTIGGVKRVNLESGNDLVHLQELDPKLWTALSCPVNGLEIDKTTLSLIDTDNDGQIRVPEMIAAVNWITAILKKPGDLLKQSPSLHISDINEEHAEGKVLVESARIILKNLGKPDADTLTVDDTSDTQKIFAGSKFNGDGVITVDSTGDAKLIQLINEVVQYAGSLTDRGGKLGINAGLLDGFIDNCQKYADWNAKKDADLAKILPFGDATAEANNIYNAIKSKVNDYFIRCRLAAFDPQSTEILNLQVARVETITAKDLSLCIEEIAAYPLAKIGAGRPLPIVSGINPAWESSINSFRQIILSSLYPNVDSITEADWQNIGTILVPYSQWIAEKQGTEVEALGLPRVKEILASGLNTKIIALIEQDIEVEDEANDIIRVDKLVRYHRDIFALLKNFVTFFDFYSSGSKAIFQAGTLYIDQRSCDLCIKVQDMPKHGSNASFSGMYLLYLDCKSRTGSEKMTIAAALTNGDIDSMVVGKNALFYDRQGIDWDATVVKIIDNPISIRQAFFSPYRKVSKFINTQINKMASAQEDKATSGLMKNVEKVKVPEPEKEEEGKAKKEPPPPPPPFDVGKFVGIFAAIGLGIGAIGTVIASVIGGFLKLSWWKMPLAIMGILLIISGPSMIIAFLKLRKRNLAPLLDANGWAINANVLVNITFGNTLTHMAELPKGAKISYNDPYTKKSFPIFPLILMASLIVGIVLYMLRKYGYINIRF